jgi:hypothetical protein
VNIPEAQYRRVSTLKGMMEYLNNYTSSQMR